MKIPRIVATYTMEIPIGLLVFLSRYSLYRVSRLFTCTGPCFGTCFASTLSSQAVTSPRTRSAVRNLWCPRTRISSAQSVASVLKSEASLPKSEVGLITSARISSAQILSRFPPCTTWLLSGISRLPTQRQRAEVSLLFQ